MKALETLVDQSKLDAVVAALNSHAEACLQRSASNFQYAEDVRQQAKRLIDLVEGRVGRIDGLMSTWMPDIKPVVEELFGVDLGGVELGAYGNFLPTVFPGVYGRTYILSLDEVNGPTVSLDVASEAYLSERELLNTEPK